MKLINDVVDYNNYDISTLMVLCFRDQLIHYPNKVTIGAILHEDFMQKCMHANIPNLKPID
jgi:hypothetical protein